MELVSENLLTNEEYPFCNDVLILVLVELVSEFGKEYLIVLLLSVLILVLVELVSEKRKKIQKFFDSLVLILVLVELVSENM